MVVQNRIIKIQKRNGSLVNFDAGHTCSAILRAAESIGGFQQDYLAGVNDRVFEACGAGMSVNLRLPAVPPPPK